MRPGVRTMVTGVILFVLGAVVVPGACILALVRLDGVEKQFAIPGSTRVEILEPGRYSLWSNHKTVFQGRVYNRSEDLPDGIQIKIRNGDTGELLDFVADGAYSSSGTGSSKRSIGYIETQGPVTIQIEVTGGNEERVFSFSRSFLSDIWIILGLALGGSCLSLIVAISGPIVVLRGVLKLANSRQDGER